MKKLPKRINWWQGGILIALIILLSFSTIGADRPVGASTGIAYLGSEMFGLGDSEYGKKVLNSGSC